MSKLKVIVEMGMPAPQPAAPTNKLPGKESISGTRPTDSPKESVEDRVREALECIDSGHDSHVEWNMINRLYRDLEALKRPNDRAKNLMRMIEPVLAKYGLHKVPEGKSKK